MAGKSSVIVRFLGDTTSLDRAAARASGALGAVESKSKSFSNSMNAVGTATAVGVAAIGVAAVKMGIDWQKQMTTLQTGAGESKKNIDLVSHGLLAMAGEVGTSSTELANGMYMIESAGYHGAAGLNVLKAAAEGAKVGNADMATVANAVTSALNSYHLKASDAAMVTNTLIATVSNGKMKMDDLAGALGNVLPVASLAHISLAEVGGALSTMTMQGVDANTAATFLRQTISKLQAPTKAQADEMKSLGLSAIDVSQNMGQRGLAGTLTLMTDAITKKMGPSGIILIEHLKKLAAHTTNFQKALIQLPPAQQTYVAALAAMMGGTKTLQGALLLSGTNMKTFAGNTKAIGAAAREGGSQIKGWTDVTADLSTQIDRVREGAKAWLTELGMQLIPILQKVIDYVGQHSDAAKKLVEVIVAALALTVAWRVATLAFAGVQAVIKVATLGWTAAQWLLNAALDANPIGLAVIAIAALVAAVVLAYQHVDWFRNIVDATWKWIQVAFKAIAAAFGWIADAARTAFGWVKEHAAILMGALALFVPVIIPITLAIRFLGAHWKGVWLAIRTVMSTVWDNFIHPIFQAMGVVIGAVGGALGQLRTIWTNTWGVIKAVILDVWNIIKPILDKIGGAVSSVVGTISKVASIAGSVGSGITSGIGGALTNVGHMLGFADGGVVPGPKGAPMLAVVHGGERVLSNKEQSSGAGMGRGGDTTIIVKNYHPTDTGQSVAAALRHQAFLMGAA